jgi:copper resistance protein D
MEDWSQPTLRFVQYALLLGLFGWAGFRVTSLRAEDWLPERSGRTTAIVAAALAPFVSIGLMLASIAAMMGQPVTTLDWSMIESMTLGTDMGWAFMARTALLVAGLVALVARRKTVGLAIAALLFAAALLTLGWSGHAAATEGALGWVHRLGNGVHLLAAGLWLGAIGWFLHLTFYAHREPEHASAIPLLTIMHRFAPFGVTLVAVVSITGLLNTQLIFGLENSMATLTTTYGLLLAAKIVIVGGMLAFGAHNAWINRGNVAANISAGQSESAALASLRRSLAIELTLGVVVIGLVAILGMLSPMMNG